MIAKPGNNYIDVSVHIPATCEIGYNNVIEEGVEIGNGVTIGNHNVIMKGTRIGDGTNIQHFVLLKPGTVIGKDCYIDSYVKSSGDNWIGDEVTLRFNSTIARKVEVDVKAFIAPNVMTIYSKHTGELSGGTYIGPHAFIGTAAVIGPNVRIGDSAVVGAQAYVNKDCEPHCIYAGTPAKLIKNRLLEE